MSRICFILAKEKDFLLPICAELSPLVEPCSEGIFLDLGNCPETQEKFYIRLGRKYFSGTASSKLVARICAFLSCNKGKSRASEVLIGGESSFLAPLPVDFLWPLPEKIIFKLKVLGLKSIGEAAKIPEEELVFQFGHWGRLIYEYSRGEDRSSVQPVYPYDTVCFREQFAGIEREEVLEEAFLKAARALSRQLELKKKRARWVKLELIDTCGEIFKGKYVFKQQSSSVGVLKRGIAAAAKEMNFSLAIVEIKATAGGLCETGFVQAAFWNETKGNLSETIGSLQKKFSKPGLRYGNEIPVSRREKVLSFWDPMRGLKV